MPAAITHYLHAERILHQLKAPQLGRSDFHDAFFWGAQGPDFLYCHRILPFQRGKSLREYAEKLHHEIPSRIFTAMREYYERCGKMETVLAYLYGFLCHYSLDRIGHPFIQCGTQILMTEKQGQYEEDLHNQIESALDAIALRYEKAILPSEFNLKRAFPKNAGIQTQIADLYAYVLNLLYDLPDAGKILFQATADCRLCFGLLNDRTGIKKAFVERMESKKGKLTFSSHIRPLTEETDIDYANTLKNEWCWPLNTGRIRSESFLELYEQSVEESLSLINRFLSGSDYAELTGEIPFV